jgi:hypothetical protein
VTNEVIRADPGLRRRALWLLLGLTLLGAVALLVLSAHLRAVSSPQVMRRWLWATVALASGGGVACGFYLLHMARHVLRAGQVPVPGQRVIRDTPVRRGRAAKQFAWVALASAGAMWTISLALPLLLWRLLRLL